MTPDQVIEALAVTRTLYGRHAVLSLDAPVADVEDAPALADLVAGPWPTPEEVAVVNERARFARALLATLPPKERSVILLRFGLAAPLFRSWTLALIGNLSGVCRQRVHQIEVAALETLRRRTRGSAIP